MRKFIKNTLRWLNLLLVLITLLAYLSPYINPAKIWHFSFLGLAYPGLLLGNLFFAALWLLRRDRYFLFSVGCILAGLGYFSGFLSLHFFNENGQSGKTISMMTYNIAGLRKYEKGKTAAGKKRMEGLKDLLKKEGIPDVLCVQEGSQNNTRELFQKNFGYPYYFKEKGTLILSKFSFVDSGSIPFKNTANACIWGDLKTELGTIRVYSVHLQSNWLEPAAMKLADENDPRKMETWKGVANVMRLYKRAVTKRAEQVELVAKHIAQSSHPIIFCGDLNDPPVSYAYHVFSKNLQDSFCEKGLGFDFTYAGKIPGLRIDYVLADMSFKVLSHQVPKLELSDHYPVLVKLMRE